MTTLVFRTPTGGASVSAGQTKQLGVVDVSAFKKIRVLAVERPDSATGITIQIGFILPDTRELLGALDILELTPNFPNSQVTRVYDVPGTEIAISVDAAGGTGSDSFDVIIFGA
jgi:hypothetical protein